MTNDNPKKLNIAIVGSSGHAKVVIDAVEKEGKYTIVGLLDGFRDVGDSVMSYQILGAEEDLPDLIDAHQLKGVFVAIGDNFVRSVLVSKIRDLCPGISFVSIVHPNAVIASEVGIGEGTIVLSGVTVNPFSTIGDFCILNTNSSLDHDSMLGDFASLGPNSATGGNCNIDQFAAVGIGAVLIQGIEIGAHSVIGAGAVVLESIGSSVVAYGVPAKEIRKRTKGEKYL